MWAAIRNLLEVVEALVYFGADLTVADKYGNTAMSLATANSAILQLLQHPRVRPDRQVP
jgi:ankyrin repeat protein